MNKNELDKMQKENPYKDYLPNNIKGNENNNQSQIVKLGLIPFYLLVIACIVVGVYWFNGKSLLRVKDRNYNMNLEETINLDTVYSSEDVEWISEDENVVVENNVVTAVGSGDAYVYAKEGNVQVSDVDLNVLSGDEALFLDSHSLAAKVGDKRQIKVNRNSDSYSDDVNDMSPKDRVLKFIKDFFNRIGMNNSISISNHYLIQNKYGFLLYNISFPNLDIIDQSLASSEGKMEYKSSDENVVLVDNNGNITMVSPGVAEVTVTDEYGNEDHTIITVAKDDIVLQNQEYTLYVGDETTIGYNLISNSFKETDIHWESSNNNIASVDNTGKVKALSVGKTEVKASVGNIEKKIIINVKNDIILPTDINISTSNIELKVSEDKTINASIIPSNVTDNSLTWASSDINIASVNNGKIVGKSEGNAIITVTTSNGIKKDIKVIVSKKSASLNETKSNSSQEKTSEVNTNYYSKETSVFYEEKVITYTSKGIQEAIDKASSKGGGTVYLPNGTYNITETIYLPAFVTLQGDGTEKTILKPTENISAVIKTSEYESLLGSISKWHDTSKVPMQFGIKNISIDGDNKIADGIDIYGYSFTIQNVEVKNVSNNGINITWGKDKDGQSDEWKDNYSKFYESYLDHIHVSNAKNIGLSWENLTDAYLDNIEVDNCNMGIHVLGNNYLGRVKINNCHTGIEIIDNSNIANINISNCDIGLKSTGWRLNVDKITCSGNKTNDMLFTNRAAHSLIRSYISTSTPSEDYIKNEGKDIRFGEKNINGKIENSDYKKSSFETNFLIDIDKILDLTKSKALKINTTGPVINVKDSGAIGNLENDDTAAIQKALDSLKTTGGVIYFPTGRYRIMKKLLIYSNITIIGAGPHTTEFYLGDNANSDANPTNVTSMMETYGHVQNVSINDISFFGNKYDNHNKNVAGLTIHGSNIVFNNVWIEGISGYGVYFGIDENTNNNYSYINGLRIRYGDSKGLILDGNGKIAVDNMDVSECKDIALDVYSPVIIGDIHLYANYGDYQLIDRGGIIANTIISETAYKTAVKLENSSAKIGILQLYANKDINLQKASSASNSYIGIYQCNDPIKDALVGEEYGQISMPWINQNISNLNMQVSNMTYTGSELKPSVMINNEPVTREMANITYKNNINVGKATVLVSGINNYIGEKELAFNILQKDISKLTMTLSATSFVYSGSAQKPTVKIGTLKSGVDYSVTYKNNINSGKASVTATGKGNYKGSITKTFIIKPPAATIVSFTPSKKSGTVKWKKNTQGTGYQISYANNSSFSSAKTITISKNSTISHKITNLTANKTYYVRVRIYKTIDNNKVYGAWSAKKSGKIKS